MSAAEDQGWKPRNEAQRRMARSPRYCSKCGDWTDHFADECEVDPPASHDEAAAALAACRRAVKDAKAQGTERERRDQG